MKSTASEPSARGGAPAATPAPSASCTLDVGGMDCGSCAASVDRALRGLEGVQDVRVDVMGGKVTVEYAEGKLARGDLTGAITRVGYRVKDDAPARREVFEVEGMDCADEVRLIEGKLGSLPGVARLGFDVVNRRLTVEGEIASAEVERAVAQLGMRALLVGEERAEATWWERRGRLVLAAVSGVFWLGSLVAEHAMESHALAAVLAVGTIVAGGWHIVPRGVRAALNRALDMNFLMSVAAVGAVLIGEYEEGASAMFLFAVAQLLETYSMDRARNAIKALMDLSPAEATVLRAEREERVPVDRVEVGETVVVRPGEKIPVDGTVLTGRSGVDQAPITGESMPVDKEPGAEVFAGSLNGEGALEVRSSKPASDTTLARIIHAVEEAQASRAPSQAFVDRFARVYTPAVVALALLVLVVPPLAGWGSWDTWIYRALALLVVACPCALVISTPVTIVSALAGGARRGILIKGGLHLENAGRVRVVALDKTGTLTEGRPEVVEVVPLDGADVSEVVALAAAAEARSQHPLARAVLRHAEEHGVAFRPAADVEAVTGKGLRARVGEETVHLGNERLFAELGALDAAARAALEAQVAGGRTAVLVGTADGEGGPVRVRGIIGIADRVRPGAADALRALHCAGISRVVMLTGDNQGTARAVAASLGGPGAGVDEFRAELLPEDKTAAVEELRRAHGAVLFVGDGVNDAPALAAADVGVAMGAGGTDVALETADIALMADDLSRLATTIRLARKAERIIRTNIAFSLLTKAVFVVLAVLGYATLWMAVAADMGASLLVVLNGLRALRE
ncbi:MAG: heavy metal translocating P-type ATPase [Longimicrobiaceae bacterium]